MRGALFSNREKEAVIPLPRDFKSTKRDYSSFFKKNFKSKKWRYFSFLQNIQPKKGRDVHFSKNSQIKKVRIFFKFQSKKRRDVGICCLSLKKWDFQFLKKNSIRKKRRYSSFFKKISNQEERIFFFLQKISIKKEGSDVLCFPKKFPIKKGSMLSKNFQIKKWVFFVYLNIFK